MSGACRFTVSTPDWGQAHLSLDAIVAYVDDELAAGARHRAEAHLAGCGECRAEVASQSQARAALRAADAPCLPSSLLRSLRSIPVDAELPPPPPGLAVTADGQFVLLRDVPPAGRDDDAGPAEPAGLAVGPAGRRLSRRARIGAVSGLALGALAVGALAVPGPTAPAPPQRGALGGPALGGVVPGVPAQGVPAQVRLSSGPTVPAGSAGSAGAPSPAVIDAAVRARLDRLPAAHHPRP